MKKCERCNEEKTDGRKLTCTKCRKSVLVCSHCFDVVSKRPSTLPVEQLRSAPHNVVCIVAKVLSTK